MAIATTAAIAGAIAGTALGGGGALAIAAGAGAGLAGGLALRNSLKGPKDNYQGFQQPTAPDPDKIREEEKTRIRRAQSERTQTSFTTPTGLTSDEPVGQKTLLGS
jgi:hypothetical protein